MDGRVQRSFSFLLLLIAHIYSIFFVVVSVTAAKCFLFRRLCRYIGKELTRKQFLRQVSINFWRGSHGFSNPKSRPCLCMRVLLSAFFSSSSFFRVLLPLLFFALVYSWTVSWVCMKGLGKRINRATQVRAAFWCWYY